MTAAYPMDKIVVVNSIMLITRLVISTETDTVLHQYPSTRVAPRILTT